MFGLARALHANRVHLGQGVLQGVHRLEALIRLVGCNWVKGCRSVAGPRRSSRRGFQLFLPAGLLLRGKLLLRCDERRRPPPCAVFWGLGGSRSHLNKPRLGSTALRESSARRDSHQCDVSRRWRTADAVAQRFCRTQKRSALASCKALACQKHSRQRAQNERTSRPAACRAISSDTPAGATICTGWWRAEGPQPLATFEQQQWPPPRNNSSARTRPTTRTWARTSRSTGTTTARRASAGRSWRTAVHGPGRPRGRRPGTCQIDRVPGPRYPCRRDPGKLVRRAHGGGGRKRARRQAEDAAAPRARAARAVAVAG